MSLTAAYRGATRSELGRISTRERLAGYADQRRLFPHSGRLELRQDVLVLQGWREIRRADVADVALTFTDVYRRGQAAGFRGQYSSLGFVGSFGKPLVLTLRDDEPVYLLIGYRWLTGSNQARRWVQPLQAWAGGGAPAR